MLIVIMLTVTMMSIIMLTVTMMSVIMLTVTMMSVIMLTVIMMSVIMLTVVAPSNIFLSFGECEHLIYGYRSDLIYILVLLGGKTDFPGTHLFRKKKILNTERKRY
jgi:hypothetical protein